jgi:beta-glucanase (GH16 family)
MKAELLYLLILIAAGCSETTEPISPAPGWALSSHSLGRGSLLPTNVIQTNGFMSLRVHGNDRSGAEIMSREAYGAGMFTVKGRCNVPPGALCAFFLYETGVGDRADEIDIEIIPANREIWFTIWNQGQRTFYSSKLLAFDPATAFHTYSMQRAAGQVSFSVDGVVMQTFEGDRLPLTVMPLFANAWWPIWLNPVRDTGQWEIDHISVD